MKFKMNSLEWTIEYATAGEVKEKFNDTNPNSVYFGCTQLSEQKILISKDCSLAKQKQTLYHELMHCYIYCYIMDDLSFDEEGICNISAKSHDIIHEIVERYFGTPINNSD